MTFRVDVTLKAYRDLSSILRWLLTEHAGEQGLSWYDGLVKAIDTLGEAPSRCPKALESGTSSREIRHLLYGNKPHVYRVLFTIKGNVVTVLHVRRPKQNPLSMH
jgi:plasmid stabilization system protein ParE